MRMSEGLRGRFSRNSKNKHLLSSGRTRSVLSDLEAGSPTIHLGGGNLQEKPVSLKLQDLNLNVDLDSIQHNGRYAKDTTDEDSIV